MVLARLIVAAALAAALSVPAHAEGGGGHGGSSGHGASDSNRIVANFTMPSDLEEEEEHVDEAAAVAGPRVVDIPTVTAPSFVDGELQGYFFVNVRLVVAEGVDAWKIREKAHLIRDALIRAGHRRSIGDAARPDRVDTELAREILLEGLGHVVPLAEIERLEIVNVDSPAS